MRSWRVIGNVDGPTPLQWMALFSAVVVFCFGSDLCHAATTGQATTSPVQSEIGATLSKYCLGCHNDRLRTADLTFEKADLSPDAGQAQVWENVVRKLHSRSMPPAGLSRRDEATYDKLTSWLEGELDGAAAVAPNPGRTPIHRLNRAEYSYAVRDLLDLDVDLRQLLPADDSGYGFDNIADALTVSPLLFERYLSTAKFVSRLAVGDTSVTPNTQTYKVSRYLTQENLSSEDLPFGSRGGMSLRHWFPVDGDYTIRIHLQRTWTEQLVGMYEPHRLDARLDKALARRFTVGGDGTRKRLRERPTFSQDRDTDESLEVRFSTTAGAHFIGVTFLDDSVETEDVLEPRLAVTSFAYATDPLRDPGIDRIDIAGPLLTTGSGET